MRQNIYSTLIGLFFVAGSGLVPSHSQGTPTATTPDLQKFYAKYEQSGVITAADHARLGRIALRIEHDHTISDDDLNFWTRLLKKGPIRQEHLNVLQFETFMLGDIGGRKILTPFQQRTLYAAVLPCVYDSNRFDWNTDLTTLSPDMQEELLSGNQMIALELLASTRDPRALPVLSLLAHDSKHPRVRTTAQNLHDRLTAIIKDSQRRRSHAKQGNKR